MSTSPTVDNNSILTKGLQSSLNVTEVVDGLLRFATDTGRMYLDVGNTRVPISEVVELYTEDQIKDLLAPLPKIYVSSDTHRAFVYSYSTLTWVDLAAVQITAVTDQNVNKVLWFSDTTDEQPNYDANLTYNPHTELLSAPNIQATTAYIGNMRIQNSLNQDNTSHTVLIDFI